ISTVREQGFPTQDREEADYEHGGRDQKVLRGPRHDQSQLGGRDASDESRGQHHPQARNYEQRRELAQELAHIALRGEQFQIHDAEEELAIEDAELEPFHGPLTPKSGRRSRARWPPYPARRRAARRSLRASAEP